MVCQCAPSAETCDGLDNDCNGVVDDEPNSNQSCAVQNGAGSTCVNGACMGGTGCQSDTDCLAGQTCNVKSHRCVAISDGGTDAGVPDSGEGLDGSLAMIDSGPPDAGPGNDAGPGEDAGEPDSGTGLDASIGIDAGPAPDAGIGVDAGQADAGQTLDGGSDAGQSNDAGFPTDAGVCSATDATIGVEQNGSMIDPLNTTLAPGSTVTLTGGESTGADPGASYEWQLASQPLNSTAALADPGSRYS